ncbi:hypothetical protein [Methyloceanibacter methanicus]|uniref:hypothetical protein n=1 Tax=Methyloceanibacter methanicus TaxID=1774968 RepID=UPI0008499565|nr:hypothetical protein [Methyloceanibacter methanicus]
MRTFYGTIALALVLGLTACSEDSSEQKASEPAAKTEDSASQAAPAPAAPPAAQAPTAAPAPADDGAGAMDGAPAAAPAPAPAADSSSKDEQACLKAVAAETQNTVATLSVDPSEANTIVMVGVGPNKAPWKCLAKDGVVAEVMSMTDEGAL